MTALRGIPAALAAAALLVPAAGSAAGGWHGHHHDHGVNVTTNGSGDATSCDQISVTIAGQPAARAEERITLPEGRDALRIVSARNSGVTVRGTDRRDFEVLACKAAPTESALSAVKLDASGGEVTVKGSASESEWVAFLIVSAPRGASLDVAATNGPIGLSGLSGSVSAHAENGPISIRDSGGDIQADAQNGPIQVRGDSGRVRVHTQNGPIGVSLTGSAWSGDGLEARAVNGPIHLAIPDGYGSGAVVESLGHSPWSCHGKACSEARRVGDDEGRSMELGSGPAVIRVSTQNGPVSIASGADDDEDD
ncbi:MAG TPA: hypothetical protein VH854_15720 [Thermoanaerobaculia bacterium]|nr:hypothetical protein [Thermoanaerobaculia bacterium]